MTVPSTPGHLDLDALADVLAGQGSGDRHLRACAACRERLAELAAAEVAVAAQLATLPSPPLPDGLSERLSDALRAEAARSPVTGGSRGPAAGASSGPGSPTRTGRGAATVSALPLRRRTPSWLPAAAAAVALVLAGGVTLSALQRPGADTSTSAAPGGGEAAEGAASQAADAASDSSATGNDYADETARTGAVADLLARAPAPEAAARSAAPMTPTGADGAAPALVGPETEPVLARLRDPAALAECLAALQRDGSPAAVPLALDYAAYDGAPALAVVQPDDDPSQLVLTVVGPGCSGTDPDRLLRTRIARR